MISLQLPFPPSVWDLYQGWGARRHRSSEYELWINEAGLEILKTPAEQRKRVVGSYSMVLFLSESRRWFKNGRRKKIDATNYFKAPEDLLVTHLLVEDDSLGEHSAVAWSKQVPDHRCEVRVWPWTTERAAIAALTDEDME